MDFILDISSPSWNNEDIYMLNDIYLCHSSDILLHSPIVFIDVSGATECVAYIQRFN